MNNNKQIFRFTIILTGLCFLSITVFTLPAFFKVFNFSTTGNIGDTIGGITAPIIGIISSILLYLALTKQTESNVNQQLKNESDIIFLLFNQLDSEINSFYYKVKQGNEEKKYYGIEAINDFAREFRYHYLLKTFNFTFKNMYEGYQFLLLVRSFQLIEKRIEIAEISNEFRSLFLNKLSAIFECKLRRPLNDISFALDVNTHLKDEITDEMQEFIKSKCT